jgi:alanine transaminase
MSASSSSSASGSSYKPVLTRESINPHVLNVEYAVRGELSNRANKYADLIAEDKGKDLAFPSVVTANIGNPQQQPFLAQKPLTFWRQVSARTERHREGPLRVGLGWVQNNKHELG